MIGETAFADAVLGTVVSEALNWSWNRIKESIEKRQDSQESYQTRMYQVVVNAFNRISGNRYKANQDPIYQISEFFFETWRENSLDENLVRKSLSILLGPVSTETCVYFIDILEEEIANNQDLFYGLLVKNSIQEEARLQHIETYVKKTYDILSQKQTNDQELCKRQELFVFDDDKQYFIRKWNSRLFLHTRDCDSDLTLKKIFILPDYQRGEMGRVDYFFDNVIYNKLEETLEDFFHLTNGSMIILGCPGIGKSSIVSYLADKYKEDYGTIILRFKNLKLYDKSFLDAICERLSCNVKKLENCTLILDGFDEIRSMSDYQERLKDFLLDIKSIKNFKLLITSRENYIQMEKIRVGQCILLKPFRENKIKIFYEMICNEEFPKGISIVNSEVLGIPVILYMALTVGIDILEKGSRADLYEKIFSLNGGIFDRFETNTNQGYELESHLVTYNKEEFNEILQDLSFKMFEVHGEAIGKKEYIDIAQKITRERKRDICEAIIYDFPIKNLYEEGNEIEFIHKSIYEYFLADYIYQTIKRALLEWNRESLANTLGTIFKKNVLTDEIRDFMLNKWSRDFDKKDEEKILETFNLMLRKGMTYFVDERDNILQNEINVFYNMLVILHCWNHSEKERIHIEETAGFLHYIRHAFGEDFSLCLNFVDLGSKFFSKINLARTNLISAKLIGSDLCGADLSGVHLNRANLHRAELNDVNLHNADLFDANLRGAKLCNSDLRNVNLSGANLENAYLNGASLDGANLRDAKLCGAKLIGADLNKANLNRADLRKANLHRADLREADLRGCNLFDVDLRSVVSINCAIIDSSQIEIVAKSLPDLVENVEVFVPKLKTVINYKEYKRLRIK